MRTRVLLCLGILMGAGCSSEDATPDPDPAPGAPRLAPDEHGVRVGGETSDFGSDETSAPDPCRSVETTELSVGEALAAGLPIDGILSRLAEPFEAPFHWGYHCEEGPASTDGDTTLTLQVELINVYRTTRVPLPDQPPEVSCGDWLEYRAVVDLATADGRIAGRFYARFDPIFRNDYTIVMYAAADARNFSGSLAAPFDLSRPHWSALQVSFGLNEAESVGSLDIEVNYTDDDPSRWPDRYGIGGYWPAGAHWGPDGLVLPADGGSFSLTHSPGSVPLCIREPYLVPSDSPMIALDDYRGSVEPPTCPVEASFWAQDEYQGVRAEGYEPPPSGVPASDHDVDVTVTIDGVARVLPAWPRGIPYALGRFPEGTTIAVDVVAQNPGRMPFAALNVDGANLRTTYDQFAFCQPAGCVAHVEGTVGGYCWR